MLSELLRACLIRIRLENDADFDRFNPDLKRGICSMRYPSLFPAETFWQSGCRSD